MKANNTVVPKSESDPTFEYEKSQSKLFQNQVADPLINREKFAVSLRKEKKKIILDMMRKKTYSVL